MNARLQPLKEHHLKVEAATPEALAPYGALLSRRGVRDLPEQAATLIDIALQRGALLQQGADGRFGGRDLFVEQTNIMHALIIFVDLQHDTLAHPFLCPAGQTLLWQSRGFSNFRHRHPILMTQPTQ